MSADSAQPLRILFIEDDLTDVELELAALSARGIEVQHQVVDTPAEAEIALRTQSWDVIVSDYNLPEMTGVDAVRLAKRLAPLTPVILVSGLVGEDLAVEIMREGAQDYVLKDNLKRLPSAVLREVQLAEVRKSGHISRLGLSLMAGLGSVLASRMHSETLVDNIPRVLVGEIGDLCVLDRADELGHLSRAALAHVDPMVEIQLCALNDAHPPRTGAKHDPARMTLSNRDGLLIDLDDALDPAADMGFRAIARDLGLGVSLAIALVVEDRVMGALNLARRYPYDPLEIEIVEELSHRIAMSIENTQLYERAQRAIRVRDEFLSIASHELKTPLTSLELQLDSIEALRATQPDLPISAEKIGRKLSVVERQVERLTGLIENLLNVTRIISGRLELKREPVALDVVVDAALSRLSEAIQRSGCTIDVQGKRGVVGDWDRRHLESVVTQLVSNAVKYGEGAPVEVGMEENGGIACLSVRDRGIGISNDQQARIFQRFERAVPEEHYGGFGLGLWMVRQIVAAHGGSVHVNSSPGEGSTFTVSLPLGEVDS